MAACVMGSAPTHTTAQSRPAADDARIDVGWHDAFQHDRGWQAEPWQVHASAEAAPAVFGPAGGTFSVTTPGSVMAWTRTVNPIWVQAFPVLVVECVANAHGEVSRDATFELLLTDDSTGPITPNALNPENPLAGEHELLLGPVSTVPGTHVFDLSKRYPSDRVSRISLRLRAGDGPGCVVLRRMEFRAAMAEQRAASRPSVPASASAGTALGATGRWIPVPVGPGLTVSADGLERALGAGSMGACLDAWTRCVRVEGIDFTLNDAAHAALASGVMETEALPFRGRWQGRTLALLMGTRLFGSGTPWYGPAGAKPRTAVRSPHQLAVKLEYADGTRATHFPWSVREAAYSAGGAMQAYMVPLDAGKVLAGFSIDERMSYGQVFVAAASISADDVLPKAGREGAKDSRRQAAPIEPPVTATSWSRVGDTLIIENSRLSMKLAIAAGLRLEQLTLRATGRPLLSAPGDLLELRDGSGAPIALRLTSCTDEAVDGGHAGRLGWSTAQGKAVGLSVTLTVRDAGTFELVPTLQNPSDASWQGTMKYPCLRQCAVASHPDDAQYLVATTNALLGGAPVQIQRAYGGPWPIPLVDLFALDGGGLGLFIADAEPLSKTLEFKHAGGKSDVAVRFDHLQVAGGAELRLPAARMIAHAGDWHGALRAYRAWARRAARPASRLKETFYCRRDYPLGGTGYLFDAAALSYTPERLLAEAARTLGAADMIDISGWAFNSRSGRVGDYLTNDLGGLPAMLPLVERAHRAGSKVGLYFEGYLIDRRCKLAARALPAWQLMDSQKKGRWWSGEMEFFACPGVVAWRREMAEMISQVAAETGADAVYVDQFGLTASKECWSPDHGHAVPSNPHHEEMAMLQAIREALQARAPRTAMYVEYVPGDAWADRVDAAFDVSISENAPGQHASKLPLYRYVFPELVSYQMQGHGIRPAPFEVDDLHRSIFHGKGLWLKGRAESWYTADFLELSRKAAGFYRREGHVLHAADCEPLIPTLQPGLYANRFAGEGRTLITLYNAGHSTIQGDLMRIAAQPGARVQDVLVSVPSSSRAAADGTIILGGAVEPWSVAVVGVGP